MGDYSRCWEGQEIDKPLPHCRKTASDFITIFSVFTSSQSYVTSIIFTICFVTFRCYRTGGTPHISNCFNSVCIPRRASFYLLCLSVKGINFTSGQDAKNAVPLPLIYGLKRIPTSHCYNTKERHTTMDKDQNMNIQFPASNFAL